jgi:hypothetical protein
MGNGDAAGDVQKIAAIAARRRRWLRARRLISGTVYGEEVFAGHTVEPVMTYLPTLGGGAEPSRRRS